MRETKEHPVNFFECEKHGRCKQYGIAGPEDNMVCSSCPDFS